MAVAGQPDQSGITRLLSTINSLTRPRETARREERRWEGGRDGAEQPADDAVCPVHGSEETRITTSKRRQI